MPTVSAMRKIIWSVGAAGAVVLAAAAFVFEPWALWQDKTVDEALPVAPSVPTQPAATGAESTATAAPEPTEPSELARGELISHEHATSGQVVVLELADGSRVLRLENLDTSSGPDVEVWITDAPVREGSDGWGVFDDGQYVELGDLKGNHGNQNYELPTGVDLDELTSVSLWCDRFNVSFGAAQLV